jgi:hypothetical protein
MPIESSAQRRGGGHAINQARSQRVPVKAMIMVAARAAANDIKTTHDPSVA